jgi:hypothetical protein
MNVNLDERQWQTVLALMAYAPGRECIPLINEISKQLQTMQSGRRADPAFLQMTPEQREAKIAEWEKGNSGERLINRGD